MALKFTQAATKKILTYSQKSAIDLYINYLAKLNMSA